MKTQRLGKAALFFIAAIFLAVGWVLFAAQTPAEKREDVKEKVTEAAEAIKNYSFDQRDKAIVKAKAALADLDARIDRMDSRLNKEWNRMDQSAREATIATLTALRKQRNEVAEWYGGLKHSSRNAWEDVKKGFLKSYQELRDAFDRTHSQF
jgi:hypothetical protein